MEKCMRSFPFKCVMPSEFSQSFDAQKEKEGNSFCEDFLTLMLYISVLMDYGLTYSGLRFSRMIDSLTEKQTFVSIVVLMTAMADLGSKPKRFNQQ